MPLQQKRRRERERPGSKNDTKEKQNMREKIIKKARITLRTSPELQRQIGTLQKGALKSYLMAFRANSIYTYLQRRRIGSILHSNRVAKGAGLGGRTGFSLSQVNL